ncbi:hypothetical protein [Salinibacillus kushneri]|nr:hypothetical protein [Salinibacillus kushneri]
MDNIHLKVTPFVQEQIKHTLILDYQDKIGFIVKTKNEVLDYGI